MAISSISSVTQTATTGTSTANSTSGNTMGISDQFMTLLLAQLKNQNPMEPMDDSQLLNQMTSLNTLNKLIEISDKIDSMASASQASYAASLIGKMVTTSDEKANIISGLVTSVEFSAGQYSLVIGSQTVDLENVIQVSEAKI